MTIHRYLLHVAVAIDQLVNAILAGNPDETISSRVGRGAKAGARWALIAEGIIDWIFEQLGQPPGHCRRKIEWDEITGPSGPFSVGDKNGR